MDKIKNLKNFAAFLLDKDLLKEAVLMNIESAREHHSSIIEKLGPNTEEEIIQIFTKSFEIFLKDLSNNKGFDNILDSFENWEKNNHNLTSSNIQATDIMMAFEIRKDVLTRLIPIYTSAMDQNLQLRDEIDTLFFLARKTGMTYIKKRN
ncbi:hypothetical protein [Sporocytophaga myxococcoides]|uniref:hypothetical protein n=1 Tax=Sporocytophaga myxococcoides TaxID=153721 RepID=UPI0004298196|nr:hypothetical protein [Sporocytophaga myxococcoides]